MTRIIRRSYGRRVGKAATWSSLPLAVVLLLLCISCSYAHEQHPPPTQRLRRQLPQTRIVGGRTIVRPKYPFFVELQDWGCGASLIWQDMVLTAAHCFQNYTQNPFRRTAVLGGIRLGEGEVTRHLVKQIPHPDFDFNTINNPTFHNQDLSYDAMLIKLNATAMLEDDLVTATQGVETISYNTDEAWPEPGQELTVMGYGLEYPNSFFASEKLKEAQVDAVSDQQCLDLYSNNPANIVPQVMFCAARDGNDSCQGDSGGPIVAPLDDNEDNDSTFGNYVQLGVVSFGHSCGREEFPGVYTRLSFIQDWLLKTICQWSCFPPPECRDLDDVPDFEPHPCVDTATQKPSGNLAFSFTITYDGFPSEQAILVEHVETATELLYVPYNSRANDQSNPPDDPLVESFQFENQPPGKYRIVVGDEGRDGMCCQFGNGNFVIAPLDGDEVWYRDAGQFEGKAEVIIELAEGEDGSTVLVDFITISGGGTDGEVTVEDSSPPEDDQDANDEDNDTEEPEEEDINNNDEGSLGIGLGAGTNEQNGDEDGDTADEDSNADQPSQVGLLEPDQYEYILATGLVQYPTPGTTHALGINIQFDENSQADNEWMFQKMVLVDIAEASSRTPAEKWIIIDSGVLIWANKFIYRIQEGLVPSSLYRFVLTDKAGNGMGSDGWVVLTNSTESGFGDDTGNELWVVRGEDFEDTATAHVWVDEEGHVQIIWDRDMLEELSTNVVQSQPSDEPVLGAPVVFPGQSEVTSTMNEREHGNADIWNGIP